MTVYVDATMTRIVPEGSPEAAFGLSEKDAKRRGLVSLGKGEKLEPLAVIATANEPEPLPVVEPEPEAKEAPAPADKSRRKPATKAR